MALAKTAFLLTIVLSSPHKDVPPSMPLTEVYPTMAQCEDAVMQMMMNTVPEQKRRIQFQYVTVDGEAYPQVGGRFGVPERYIVESWSCDRQRNS